MFTSQHCEWSDSVASNNYGEWWSHTDEEWDICGLFWGSWNFSVATEENQPRFEPGIFFIQVIVLHIDAYCITELVPSLKRNVYFRKYPPAEKGNSINVLAPYNNNRLQLDKSDGIEIGSACSAQVTETKEFSSSFCKKAAWCCLSANGMTFGIFWEVVPFAAVWR